MALELYKTARANIPTGGLGATVNIVTAKPFQQPGEKFSLMLKGIHDSSNEVGENVTPEVAGIYSITFEDDRFGFSANFSYYNRDFQRQAANIQGWKAFTDATYDVRTQNTDGTFSTDAVRFIDDAPLPSGLTVRLMVVQLIQKETRYQSLLRSIQRLVKWHQLRTSYRRI